MMHMILNNGTVVYFNQSGDSNSTSNATSNATANMTSNTTSNATNSTMNQTTASPVDMIPTQNITAQYVQYNISVNGTNFHSLLEQMNLHIEELQYHYYSKTTQNRTTNLYAHMGRAHASINSLIEVTNRKTSHPDDLAMYVWLMSIAVLVIGASVGYIACKKSRKVGEDQQQQYAQINSQPA